MFFRTMLEQTPRSTTKTFRWPNGGELSTAFNCLLDEAAAIASIPAALENLPTNLATVAAAMGITVPATRFQTKIKDWQAGGTTRYSNGKNKACNNLESRKAAVLQFFQAARDSGRKCLKNGDVEPAADLNGPLSTTNSPPAHVPTHNAHPPPIPTPHHSALPSAPTSPPAHVPHCLAGPWSATQAACSVPAPSGSAASHQQQAPPFNGLRMLFTPPTPVEGEKWAAISDRLQAATTEILSEYDGAKALDGLHVAMVDTMRFFGYEREAVTQKTRHDRPPLGMATSSATREVKQSRKEAREGRTPWSSVWANVKVRESLFQAGKEEQQAKEIRRNHQLAQANPKRLADMVWGRAMGSDPPECSAEECEQFFRGVFAPTETLNTSPSWLPPQRGPLNLQPLVVTQNMVQRCLRNKARTASAPGIDGVTYSMWASIPWIPGCLADLYNKLIQQRGCPSIWKFGWTVLLHKGGPRNLSNYRPITLTPTLAKLFHAIVAGWLEKGIISAGIISTELQKGFLTGVAGAIEHDLVLDEAIWQAKHHHHNIFTWS